MFSLAVSRASSMAMRRSMTTAAVDNTALRARALELEQKLSSLQNGTTSNRTRYYHLLGVLAVAELVSCGMMAAMW
eukprot:CAMPEP_0177655510 /NCGR_PEP_ID=MMETSP0447-20121125/15014_1 /TAXON_ID=0 /ORGANISM="Stygamoeba regulata, Strain BSH-02190019" /LENGTH=75 /DNA_ID=CAMNT_0019159451 /DNA_START=44 /DNA_END=268 /DNA_ORIENTATION=-